MTRERRTKIVCTIGPASQNEDTLREMMRAGMDVARLNFSHGSYEYHLASIELVRRVADDLGANVAVMVDTKGPEIRTRPWEGRTPVSLEAGQHVMVTTRTDFAEGWISINYLALPHEVEPGSSIFIDDGLIELRVEAVENDTDIRCIAVNDGTVGERKGVNVPNVALSLPSVTEQDEQDIRFACEQGADAIAISFVRDADAVQQVRAICKECGRKDMMLIAKIETPLALKGLEDIVKASDGIMVARGDLGVEIPPAQVPNVQKDVIQMCNRLYKPVITATQMLESMTHNPRPTRAEVTDVANAIYDGTDCVMLSGETAAGEHPVAAVRMMAEICRNAEPRLETRRIYHDNSESVDVSGVASFGAVEMARRVGATAIMCPTSSGRTARTMAAYKPSIPIIAIVHSMAVMRYTCFFWGVDCVLVDEQDGIARTCYSALKVARRCGLVDRDDYVVITAGDPVTSPLIEGSGTSTNVCMIAQVF